MKNILKISLLAIIISLFNFANFTYAEDVTPPTLDVIPPIITLLGDATVHIAQNATYVDFGAGKQLGFTCDRFGCIARRTRSAANRIGNRYQPTY